MIFTRVSIIVLSTLCVALAKIYQRCELVRELRNFDVPEDEIPTWVCIVQHESNYNTSAMNPGSGDHGLFQISQLYWCSPPGEGYGCNSPCSKFRDDDISDDLRCIRRIFNEHKRISGDGFNAWTVYPLYCKDDLSRYMTNCSESELKPENVTENEIVNGEDGDEYGDGYKFPPLPQLPKNGEEENGDGYVFPKLPFDKHSIGHTVEVDKREDGKIEQERVSKSLVSNKENQKLPFSEVSIHHSKPAVVEKYTFEKLPFSKNSIHHFVAVSTESILKYEAEGADELATTTEQTTTIDLDIDNKGSSAKAGVKSIQSPDISVKNVDYQDTNKAFKEVSIDKLPFSSNIRSILRSTENIPLQPLNPTMLPLIIQRRMLDLSKLSTEAPYLQSASSIISFKQQATTKSPYTTITTQKPTGKQVTFAPDSFFSWLFNSQTLPPVVPPVRPSRPPGEGGPGNRPTTFRPVAEGGPGRPPRPPRPGRPGVLQELGNSTTRRPVRPINTNRPQRRPMHAFGRPSRRPLHRPGFHLASQRSSTASYGLSSVTTTPHYSVTHSHGSTSVSTVFPNKEFTALFNSTLNRGSNSTHVARNRQWKNEGVEIKLNDHMVFLRTKYGYRLFRSGV